MHGCPVKVSAYSVGASLTPSAPSVTLCLSENSNPICPLEAWTTWRRELLRWNGTTIYAGPTSTSTALHRSSQMSLIMQS